MPRVTLLELAGSVSLSPEGQHSGVRGQQESVEEIPPREAEPAFPGWPALTVPVLESKSL